MTNADNDDENDRLGPVKPKPIPPEPPEWVPVPGKPGFERNAAGQLRTNLPGPDAVAVYGPAAVAVYGRQRMAGIIRWQSSLREVAIETDSATRFTYSCGSFVA